MFNRKILAAGVLGLAALTATPAAAQTSVVVETADLQLASEAGQRTLDTRLRTAVRTICGDRPSALALGETQTYRQCVATSTASFQSPRQVAIAKATDTVRMAINDDSQSNNAG